MARVLMCISDTLLVLLRKGNRGLYLRPATHDGLGNPSCIYLACEHCVVPVLDFEERYIDAVQYVRVKPWIQDHDSEMSKEGACPVGQVWRAAGPMGKCLSCLKVPPPAHQQNLSHQTSLQQPPPPLRHEHERTREVSESGSSLNGVEGRSPVPPPDAQSNGSGKNSIIISASEKRSFYSRIPPLAKSASNEVRRLSSKDYSEAKISNLFEVYKDQHCIQSKFSEMLIEVQDPEKFKDLYRFTFKFGLDADSGQRILPSEMALLLWKLVFSQREPSVLKRWLTFLERHPHIRGIPRDTWNMFLNFTEAVGDDLSSYDDTEAWPSLFDDFVEYENDQLNQNISKDHKEESD
ncbi:hypothetical protein O3P69_016459 [Scylla paramamosain]|uniref:Defective in cullin neddylation protein n=1 Tax=Scylla paramamosain TaxID=85552 RepID=A0AAW0TEH2_SCYPA